MVSTYGFSGGVFMYGLALEGGGVKGAFHMGAAKALIEEGYSIGGITGTSIGALNGAIIAQGDFEAGYRLWESMDAPLIFDIEEKQYKKLIDRHIDTELLLKLAARMGEIIENKGIDTGKMRQVVESIVDEDKLRSSAVDFGLVTVSLTDLKPLELYKEDIPEGKMVDYLMASASFPGFKLNPIGDKYYIDGAFYDNCPINLLARKGYREIIAVRTFGPGRIQHLRYHNVKVTNIIPSEDLGMTLDFNRDLIRRNLQMGYYDTMRCIKGLRGRKYYINPDEEDRFFSIFQRLPDKLVQELAKKLRIKEIPAKRLLFERIIPELVHMMGLPAASEYQDILIGLLEEVAEDVGVDRFAIYSVHEMVNEIRVRPSGRYRSSARRTGMNRRVGLNKRLADALKRKKELKEAAGKIFDAICVDELL